MSILKRTTTFESRLRKAKAFLFLITLLTASTVVVGAAYAMPSHPQDDEVLRRREAQIAERMREDTNRTVRPSESNVQSERQVERNTPVAQNDSVEWMLTLVNASNPLPDNHSPKLKSLANGLQFDERAIGQLNAMLSAMRSQGLFPVVCSAYRTIEYQRILFNNKASQLMASGLSQTQAETEARRHIAYPGTSEHNLGLAVDIVSMGYQLLNDNQANTPEVKWLLEHCAEYGFILRYPKGKEAVTGIIFEPWHFRYVGLTAAQAIMENGLCLEEYLSDKR